ncbi:MAG: SCP2 sterol-binding domain-containing protein [Thiohalocapsa sp.]|jgi:predicted lipid carrier protein YhbT|uniref:ubiquinone anaerobic biosynthesis accessory factor UbiT n=1 Tax=Thiohalocapsa sp. TaxID=2497641 RepID=UPI0025CF964E|nr:SCP2 sterol-binding domain-containing protein [Thiohalocapsa sp.]MCG6940228.1 SCP2 sterol-binding domain-containing protein [Thiohalocapsa sp.]
MTPRTESFRSPRLPSLLTLPFGLIPPRLNSAVLAQILNRVFKPELADGELDFLDHKVMRIGVDDARLTYRLTLRQGRLEAARPGARDDLSIEGSTYEFLLLATRREDPDTLFFNRRLRLGGDTELGLYTKNLLDSIELEDRAGPLLGVMNRATDLLARFGTHGR